MYYIYVLFHPTHLRVVWYSSLSNIHIKSSWWLLLTHKLFDIFWLYFMLWFWFNLLFFTRLFVIPRSGIIHIFFVFWNKNYWRNLYLSATIYIFKVNSKDTRGSSKICSKLIIAQKMKKSQRKTSFFVQWTTNTPKDQYLHLFLFVANF